MKSEHDPNETIRVLREAAQAYLKETDMLGISMEAVKAKMALLKAIKQATPPETETERPNHDG